MRIGDIKSSDGSTTSRKRVGRGPGSDHGKTSCRGHKGQKARSGGSIPARFEGGQMPLQRRLPKRGFTNIFRVEKQVVNVRDLERFDAGTEVNPETLLQSGLVGSLKRPIKLLAEGEVTKSLTIKVHACSKKAKEAVEKAGGSLTLID